MCANLSTMLDWATWLGHYFWANVLWMCLVPYDFTHGSFEGENTAATVGALALILGAIVELVCLCVVRCQPQLKAVAYAGMISAFVCCGGACSFLIFALAMGPRGGRYTNRVIAGRYILPVLVSVAFKLFGGFAQLYGQDISGVVTSAV